MWTGRQTLASIEQAIAELHQQEATLDGTLRTAMAEAERLRHDRDEALRELARIKLDEISAGRLVRNLDAAERRAVQILENGRHRLAAEMERKTAAVAELQQAESNRHAAGAVVETALGSVEQTRADVETKVKTQPTWQKMGADLKAADDIAGEAEKKATLSKAELGQKQKPYDGDKLFNYLWVRKFGTAAYQGGNVTRMMDRVVADFVGYSDARANYAMLLEIPKRLVEHAEGKRAAANALKSSLGDFERQAMVMAGIEPKERALTEARHKLAAAEETLEAKRTQLKAIDHVREALLKTGSDPGYGDALKTIAQSDAQDAIAVLYAEARRTATPADEAMVRRIEQIDGKVAGIERELGEIRQAAHALAQRRLDLENTRERFRGAGYDHPSVVFGNEVDIGRVLAGILEGAVHSGILWDILRGGYGTRPSRSRPTFGAPTFPFPFPMPGGGDDGPSGGGWRLPESQGGWFPSGSSGSGSGNGGGSSADGGFTTGGEM
jgi:chromosome segregation ATPase